MNEPFDAKESERCDKPVLSRGEGTIYKHPEGIVSAEERKVLIWELRAMIAKQDRIITSYQIAKDNLELRLARAVLANDKPIVGTFAGHWTY